jgi:hypothetical protein
LKGSKDGQFTDKDFKKGTNGVFGLPNQNTVGESTMKTFMNIQSGNDTTKKSSSNIKRPENNQAQGNNMFDNYVVQKMYNSD